MCLSQHAMNAHLTTGRTMDHCKAEAGTLAVGLVVENASNARVITSGGMSVPDSLTRGQVLRGTACLLIELFSLAAGLADDLDYLSI